MNAAELKKYISKNIIPIVIEVIFIALALLKVVPMIYLNFFFYLALIVYFGFRGEYSWSQWKSRMKTKDFGKNFLTSLSAIGIGFLIMTLVQQIFSGVPLGEFDLQADTPFKLFLFGIQTIIFPPLAEEMFYLKYLISTHNKKTAIITLLISSVFFAAEHAIYPFGLFTYMILGLAFGMAYLHHRDIYAMMTAHFVVNLVGNGISIIKAI